MEEAGTNVLSEEDVAAGPERLRKASQISKDRIASFRHDLNSGPDKDEIEPWLREMDQIEKGVAAMEADDEQIFKSKTR